MSHQGDGFEGGQLGTLGPLLVSTHGVSEAAISKTLAPAKAITSHRICTILIVVETNTLSISEFFLDGIDSPHNRFQEKWIRRVRDGR